MNEDKIRTLKYKTLDLLALQPSEEDEPFTISKTFEEVFAELIVRECAKTIQAQDVDPSFKNRMSWAIKKQFGVEE